MNTYEQLMHKFSHTTSATATDWSQEPSIDEAEKATSDAYEAWLDTKFGTHRPPRYRRPS